MIIQIIGITISGIEKVEDFYNPGIFAIIGLVIFSLGMALVTIPVMPEILDAIEDEPNKPSNINEQEMYNKLAGYFIMCQGLGESVGPFTTSCLDQHMTFRKA